MATARLGGLAKELTLATVGLTGPEAAKALARFARAELGKVVAAKTARNGAAPGFLTSVNGRVGALEESVNLPGPIIYTFDANAEIGAYLFDFLVARAPKLTGDYVKSFVFIQNGRKFAWSSSLKMDTEYYITNTRAFSRKIELGVMKKMRVMPHIFEDARQAAQRRYGNLAKFQVRYLDLTDGYILKGMGRKRRGKSRAGERMRYPAVLVMPL